MAQGIPADAPYLNDTTRYATMCDTLFVRLARNTGKHTYSKAQHKHDKGTVVMDFMWRPRRFGKERRKRKTRSTTRAMAGKRKAKTVRKCRTRNDKRCAMCSGMPAAAWGRARPNINIASANHRRTSGHNEPAHLVQVAQSSRAIATTDAPNMRPINARLVVVSSGSSPFGSSASQAALNPLGGAAPSVNETRSLRNIRAPPSPAALHIE